MIETGLAQLRFAASIAFGWPFSPWALDHLIEGLLATRREFGTVEEEASEALGGPTLDEETRSDAQLRRFRAQATRAVRQTLYYHRLFAGLALDPRRLRFADLARIPPTSQEALRSAPDDFVARDAQPCFRTTTTGTTGRPTSVCFSGREIRAYTALSAIHFLTSGRIGPEDIVQISASSRATLGNTCFAGACARVGAMVYLAGLIEPAQALAALAEERRVAGKKRRASYLSIYPSYLGELLECGLRLGYGPANFGLERIAVGGEIVTAGLRARCRQLFGSVRFDEGYAMTETWPLAGARCEEGHLHYEVSQGLVEVLDPETGVPARPGAIGTVVATPFAPYRETTLVLRYDTRDIVRPIAGPLTCSLRNLPATTDLLGKRRFGIRHDAGWTFPRDVLEALEAIEVVPLPARCGFWAVPGGVAVEVVARADTAEVRRVVWRGLEGHAIPVRELHLRGDRSQLRQPLPLRCDLREVSFDQPGTPPMGEPTPTRAPLRAS